MVIDSGSSEDPAAGVDAVVGVGFLVLAGGG